MRRVYIVTPADVHFLEVVFLMCREVLKLINLSLGSICCKVQGEQ